MTTNGGNHTGSAGRGKGILSGQLASAWRRRVGSRIHVGQRFQKADHSGIVFEVVKVVKVEGREHAHLAQVDWPSERRIYAAAAVLDRRMFLPLKAGEPGKRRPDEAAPAVAAASIRKPALYGAGDRIFLDQVATLTLELRYAGEEILERVRLLYRGDLTPCPNRRYVESPVPFWSITIQPRDRSLAIQVKGTPDLFSPSSLDMRLTSGSNTRFKVHGTRDVPEALRIIATARKNLG